MLGKGRAPSLPNSSGATVSPWQGSCLHFPSPQHCVVKTIPSRHNQEYWRSLPPASPTLRVEALLHAQAEYTGALIFSTSANSKVRGFTQRKTKSTRDCYHALVPTQSGGFTLGPPASSSGSVMQRFFPKGEALRT